MACRNPNNYFSACGILGLIISIIFGAIVGILYAIGALPFIWISIWVDLGLGILSLIFLFIDADLASLNQQSSLYKCLRCDINFLLSGTIGTIISALAFLSIVPLIYFIPSIVLVVINAFFFALLVVGWITLLNCILFKRVRVE